MRRAQKSPKWSRKQATDKLPLGWFPIAALVYGCEPAPAKTIAHKYLRILKRLESGQMLQWDKASKSWKWETGGKVKASWLFKLRDMGYANVTQSLWLLTVAGRRLFGPITDSARLIEAAANVPDRRVA